MTRGTTNDTGFLFSTVKSIDARCTKGPVFDLSICILYVPKRLNKDSLLQTSYMCIEEFPTIKIVQKLHKYQKTLMHVMGLKPYSFHQLLHVIR